METYFTIGELAEYLKLAEQTVRRWVLNHEIPYHKIKKVIRFRVSEIEKWIDSGGILQTSAENDVEVVESFLFDNVVPHEELLEENDSGENAETDLSKGYSTTP